MSAAAYRSRIVHDNGRSFTAKWYKQANQLVLVTISVTKDGKNAYVTHSANMREESAESYVDFEQNKFYKGIENERDYW